MEKLALFGIIMIYATDSLLQNMTKIVVPPVDSSSKFLAINPGRAC